MLTRRLMWIVWPAFLTAAALELLVFAFFDPRDLYWFGQPLGLSRMTVYSLTFFAFWALTIFSSALTVLLSLSAREVNAAEPARGTG